MSMIFAMNPQALLPISFLKKPESGNRFTLSGQFHWHTFPANGATCRSAQGPVRTVSEGNADRAGGDVGGWWCRASVTGTSIRALSFPPVLMSAMGTHTKPGAATGQGTNTCQEILSLWSEWAGPKLMLPWRLDSRVKAAENVKKSKGPCRKHNGRPIILLF